MNKPNSNGYDALLIHQRKGLNKNQQILDNMGSTELALFRAMEGEEKLRREEIQGKNKAHLEVGKKVRQTIEVLGGAMAEDLTTLVEGLEGRGKCWGGVMSEDGFMKSGEEMAMGRVMFGGEG